MLRLRRTLWDKISNGKARRVYDAICILLVSSTVLWLDVKVIQGAVLVPFSPNLSWKLQCTNLCVQIVSQEMCTKSASNSREALSHQWCRWSTFCFFIYLFQTKLVKCMFHLLRNVRKANECEKLLLFFLFSSQTFVVYFWSHCWSLSHMIDIFTGIHLKKIFFLGTWAVLVDVMILSENYWTWKIWQDCPRIQVETTNYTHIICPLKQMHQFSNKESKWPLHL